MYLYRPNRLPTHCQTIHHNKNRLYFCRATFIFPVFTEIRNVFVLYTLYNVHPNEEINKNIINTRRIHGNLGMRGNLKMTKSKHSSDMKRITQKYNKLPGSLTRLPNNKTSQKFLVRVFRSGKLDITVFFFFRCSVQIVQFRNLNYKIQTNFDRLNEIGNCVKSDNYMSFFYLVSRRY